MTKKHYKAFAALISKMRKSLKDIHFHEEEIIDEFETGCIEEFAKDNPAFNITKFMEAAR